MVRRMSVVLSAAVLLAAALSAEAQRPKGQGGQGQRGQGQGPGGFGGFGVTGLLGMEAVQKELGVTAEQKGLIDEMLKDLRPAPGGGGSGNRQDFQNLSQEERDKRIAEIRKQVEERAKKAEDTVKVILDAKQVARLNELRLQREGPASLERDEVAAKLELTSEQKDKIKKIRDEARPQRGGPGGAGGGGGNLSQEERQKLVDEATARRTKTNAELLAVLTPKQKETWESMQGKKFEFPAPQARRPAAD